MSAVRNECSLLRKSEVMQQHCCLVYEMRWSAGSVATRSSFCEPEAVFMASFRKF